MRINWTDWYRLISEHLAEMFHMRDPCMFCVEICPVILGNTASRLLLVGWVGARRPAGSIVDNVDLRLVVSSNVIS